MLGIGGAGYLVGLVAVFLAPEVGEKINVWATVPSAIGEIAMVLYLLGVGVRRASGSASLSASLSASPSPSPAALTRT